MQLRITFPDGGDSLPVILWSHGLFGTKTDYSPLTDHWTENGYICIRPDHSDSRALHERRMSVKDPEVFKDWRNRPKDLSFILDSLHEIESRIPELRGRIDAKRAGAGGHSYGAHTTQLLAGALIHEGANNGRRSYADERLAAFLIVSPQNLMNEFDVHSWRALERPCMFITGTKDTTPKDPVHPFSREEPYESAAPGDKYYMLIENGYHNFGGINGGTGFPGAGPNNETQVAYIQNASTALWDAYLKSDSRALGYLKSDNFENESKGAVTLKWK